MTSPIVWPFATRFDGPHPGQDGSGQWRRIDQGQDLQAAVGTPMLAVADGTIVYAHNASGFGDPYPVLHLKVPIQGVPAIYYGHAHPEAVNGAVLRQGDLVAHAAQVPGGNASGFPGWLELGPWSSGPTGNGTWMHNLLLPAPVYGPAQPTFRGEDDMPTVVAQDAIMNPNHPGQGYVLDSQGGIHPVGGAPAASGGPYWDLTSGEGPARRILIDDWSKPSGWVLDCLGALHPFGGAPTVSGPYWEHGFVPPPAQV